MGCIINFKVLSNLGQKINKKILKFNNLEQSVITIICLVYKNKKKKICKITLIELWFELFYKKRQQTTSKK